MMRARNLLSSLLGAAAIGALCVDSVAAAQISAHAMTTSGQPVANAAVYATLLSGTPPARPRREAAIEQINKEFVPLVSVIQTGTPVSFPNRDTIRHHVYSFSPAKSFEIKLYSGVPVKPLVFDKPGEVVLGCNIHDAMIAYVLVVDTPFFGKTDARGRVDLAGLPAGEYEVQLWYPGMPQVALPQQVKLGENDGTELKFTFNPRPIAPRPAGGAGKS